MWWVFFLLLFLALAAFLIFARIHLHIKSVEGRRNFFMLELRIWRIPLYKTCLYLRLKHYVNPVIIRAKKGRRFKILFRYAKKKKEKKKKPNLWIKSLGKACRVSRLHFSAVFNAQDAAATALLCGFLNNFFQLLCLFFKKKIEDSRICICPDFGNGENFFSFTLDGIITARFADIISVYYKERDGEKYAPNRNHFEHDHVRA